LIGKKANRIAYDSVGVAIEAEYLKLGKAVPRKLKHY